MNSIVRHVKNASELRRNFALLISGNGIAQILPILAYPVLTRIYAPSSFGEFAVFAGIHNIILTISTGRFDSTIILPKDRKESENLFNIGLSIALAFSMSIPFFMFFTNKLFSFSNEIEGIWLFFYFISITVLTSSFSVLVNSWCTREKKFKLVFQYILVLNILTPTLKILLGFYDVENGLLISFIIAQVVSSSFFFINSRRKLNFPKIHLFNPELISTLKKYQDFPKYQAPKTLINTLSGNLPIFLLTYFFSSEVTGLFSLALTLLLRPIHIYNNSSSQVLSQKIVEMKSNNKKLWPIIQKFLIRTFFIYLFPALILAFTAPALFEFFLGSEWKEAGKFCQVMIPWSVFVLLGGSIAFIPTIFLKQAKELIIDVVYIIVRLLALIIGLFFKDPLLAVALFAIAGVFVISYQLLWYRKLLINWDSNIK